MNSKEYLTNRSFCPMPWTGLMYNFDGKIKNCIRSAAEIGNIQQESMEEIVNGTVNTHTKSQMLSSQPGPNCSPCYQLEKDKNSFDVISDRIFYLRELKQVPLETYQQADMFNLHTVDVRWSNLCNFSCIYCGPEFSSQWTKELSIKINTPSEEKQNKFKNYIFDHVAQLKHVYMAGGEPLLMKENLEFVELLKEKNPEVNLRINTNLSKVDTHLFNLLSEFKNVHWIISVESMEQEYEYIRYGGKWQDFLDNLEMVRQSDHKISFNMLHFILNYQSIFSCIDFLKNLGFHNNSFIIGPITGPIELDIRILPAGPLTSTKEMLMQKINERPGYLLENSYQNMLAHIELPFNKNLVNSVKHIEAIDTRRKLESKKIFLDFYKWTN